MNKFIAAAAALSGVLTFIALAVAPAYAQQPNIKREN